MIFEMKLIFTHAFKFNATIDVVGNATGGITSLFGFVSPRWVVLVLGAIGGGQHKD